MEEGRRAQYTDNEAAPLAADPLLGSIQGHADLDFRAAGWPLLLRSALTALLTCSGPSEHDASQGLHVEVLSATVPTLCQSS